MLSYTPVDVLTFIWTIVHSTDCYLFILIVKMILILLVFIVFLLNKYPVDASVFETTGAQSINRTGLSPPLDRTEAGVTLNLC